MMTPRLQGVTMKALREDWTIYDMQDAHELLNLIEEAEADAMAKQERTK